MRRVARCQSYHEDGRQLSDGKGPVPAAAGAPYAGPDRPALGSLQIPNGPAAIQSLRSTS